MRPMGRPRLRDLHLPPRMRRRGKRYYYRAAGKEIALGSDLARARAQWAEFENVHLAAGSLFRRVADRWELEVVPTKAPRTQSDYKRHLAVLRKVFDEMPIAAIAPHHVRRYLNLRMAASIVQANRERAVLSMLFNWARGEGITDVPNPCAGIHGKKEPRREVYVDDEAFARVWGASPPAIRDAMDLARLTGQRPADVLRMARTEAFANIERELAAARERSERLWASIGHLRTAALIDDWGTFNAIIAEATLDAGKGEGK